MTLFAARAHPLVPEYFAELRELSDLNLSPDGRRVVTSVKTGTVAKAPTMSTLAHPGT